MRRAAFIAFAAGSAAAIMLAVFWRLVNAGNIPLTTSSYMRFSSVTLWFWPSSFMLMEVDPLAPLNVERVVLYAAAILLNGVFYSIIVAVLWKIAKGFGR